MIERELLIQNRLGLHARATAKLVQTVSAYRCSATVSASPRSWPVTQSRQCRPGKPTLSLSTGSVLGPTHTLTRSARGPARISTAVLPRDRVNPTRTSTGQQE